MTASIGSILSNARSALAANQAAINTTAHNIANAETEGYTRKRVDLRADTPQMMPYGSLGRGVVVADIPRVRDTLLDLTFRMQSADSSRYGRRSELLGQIEELYAEPSPRDLGAALDSFWGTWSDLAAQPLNDAARMSARQAGDHLASQLQRLSSGLDNIASGADLRMRQDVAQLNQYAAEVAELNEQIIAAESAGQTAGDLRDARDRSVDGIASLAQVQVFERSNGSIAVVAGDATIVDGDDSVALAVDTTGGTYRIRTERGTIVRPTGGLIGASIAVLNTDLPAAQAELDALARAVVSEVNAVHANGMNPLGQTGVAFFDNRNPGDPTDVSNVTAGNIALSAAVLADHRAIAAGEGVLNPGTGLVEYAAGANDVALALAGLRDAPSAALGGVAAGEYYASAVTRIGTDVRAAVDGAAIHGSLAANADTRRMSVTGVSIDEELVKLIQYQNAYAAAARVITAADELFETVIGMMR
jgi:flagellar hook-associated protein 1 FlgK